MIFVRQLRDEITKHMRRGSETDTNNVVGAEGSLALPRVETPTPVDVAMRYLTIQVRYRVPVHFAGDADAKGGAVNSDQGDSG